MSLANKLSEERRARLAAERLLEQKQAELFAANRKLGRHARALSDEIVETRAEVNNVRDENKKVKSDLSAAHQKVEIAERRLWLSIETIQDGFAYFDVDSRMIAANNSYLSVFEGLEDVGPGMTYVQMLQLLTDEGIVNIGDQTPTDWRAFMLKRWQQPSPKPTVIRLWNGLYIKLIDQRGHGGDVVSLALNITETVRYEKELKKQRRMAESASRAKSAFLANMSHEIRTPMNGVVGMAEILNDTPLSEEQKLYVNTIKNSGEALLVIINDVLDYSKIEAEKLKLHPEPFDLERCIHEIIMLLQPTARDKGLNLLIDYDLFLPTHYVGDPGRIRQVLTNLIGNAVKFTTDGHVLVRVVGMRPEDSKETQVHVTVEDTGVGIPADKIQHIFGEFNQVEDERNRQFEGTGLGLAISQRLIEMMGGEIWVDSQENVGSAFGFKVRMPVADSENLSQPELPTQLKKVVIVDDNQVNRAILEKNMSQLGIETIVCSTGADALDSLDSGIDLVLTDHNMPEMDGLELAEEIRARNNPVPIILLSSNPGFAEQDPSRRHLHAILQKPLSRSQFFTQLQSLGTEIRVLTPSPSNTEARFEDKMSEVARVRILAAEDNKTNQLVFRKMVKGLNIDLEFASNGIEAVDAFGAFRPDVIFMDISMPKMDGKEATRKIRELERETGGHVPIIAMTAHAMAGDSENILKAGLDEYLTKPLRKTEILERIQKWLPKGSAPL